MKLKSVKQLKKTADEWVSKSIRLRDSEIVNGEYVAECITCNVRKPYKQMQAGHFVSRRVNALRYDDVNVNAQCLGCNMFKQGEQFLYAKALDEKYGAGTAEDLMARRHETHKLTIPELETIIADAKIEVKFYLSKL